MTINPENLPTDDGELRTALGNMSAEDLSNVLGALVSKFDEVYGDGTGMTEESMSELEALGVKIKSAREVETATAAADTERTARASALRDMVSVPAPSPEGDSGADDKTDDDTNTDDASKVADPKTELIAASAATVAAGPAPVVDLAALSTTIAGAVGKAVTSAADAWLKPATDLNKHIRQGVPGYGANPAVPVPRGESVLVASADVPGFTQGGKIESMKHLGRAMHQRARTLGVSTTGSPQVSPVASLEREFRHIVDGNASMQQVSEIINSATDVEMLTASGGWCSPAEVSYNFYNVVCEDGMWEVPRIGLTRGSIQHPVSPSYGDLASINALVFRWTEQEDIDASVSSSVFKPTAHIPCPSFTERIADCYPIFVTAGNLTSYAFPEANENWIQLAMAIRAHATNAQMLDMLLNGGGSGDPISASVAVDHTGIVGNATAAILSSMDTTATGLREKYSMCDGAIVEVVLPRWSRMAIRSDLANRQSIDALFVTDDMIADWFNVRNIRAQFVADWQVRESGLPGAETPITDIPSTMQYAAYTPGTFAIGESMSLDMGVVRDSVLNSTNDFTAVAMEECMALIKLGHESRVVTVNTCTAGQTGSTNLTCA